MNKIKVKISPRSGFCFGVRRALDIADKALKEGGTVYSLGPIIHNPQVVDEFSKKGLKIINGIRKVMSKKKPSLLIPSHGINPNSLKKGSIFYIDTTCPLVERVQGIVKDLKQKGYFIVIVGDKKHPEVRGLVGMAGKKVTVVKDRNEAKTLRLKQNKIALISQTTASLENFKEILSEMAKKDFTELISFNTVCKNTIDRQEEAQKIAKKVDTMLIIGGKNSANTTKLAKACKKINKNTYHIESGKDLKTKFFKNGRIIGIATGASTPPYAIREVMNKIKEGV